MIEPTEITRAPATRAQWVFVHGAAGSSSFWELVRPAFPGAWLVDLPGHAAGRARHNDPAPAAAEPILDSIDDVADWLMAEIAARQWDEVVLVGHSMGGAIAQVAALRRPAWLRGLVLSCTGPILPVPAELIDLVQQDYPAAVEWILAHSFATPPTGYRREGIRRQLLRIPPALTLADYRACNAFDIRAPLEQAPWSFPTLILCGEKDRMTSPAYSEFLMAHITGAQLAFIENAGHMAPVEQPAAWVAAVQRLWAQMATATHPAPGAA
jgi:pimeloyl-ACP methyl ester carboxylesterase